MSTELAPDVTAIQQAWEKHVLTQRPAREPNDNTDARKHIYAGGRRKCLRRMVEEAVHPSYFPDFPVEMKAHFIRGEQRELDLRQSLERVGQLSMPRFTFEGVQEYISVKDRKGRVVIRGKIDGRIRWESRAKWPTEFKSWSVFLTDRIFTFQDLWNSPYTWGGAHQLLSYLYAQNEPYGLLVLDRPGLPRLIKVSLEEAFSLEGMESFLKDAEICVDHIEAGTLPSYIDDPAECRRCPIFGSHCNPPLSYDGAAIITEDEILAQIEMHESLDQPRKDYKGIHEDLADYLQRMTPKTFKGKNRKQIIAGKYLISASWNANTTYQIPEEIKAQYKSTDDSGKFGFSVTKITE